MLTGSHCGNTAALLSAHQSIGVPQPLLQFGTEDQKQRFLPRCARGEISAFALTEAAVGSDPARMETTAEPTEDGEHFILNGSKLWCTNGTKEVDQRGVAVARLDEVTDVLDVLVRRAQAGALDRERVPLVARSEALDAVGERGGDHMRAARLGRLVEDALELLAEAHVEHLVRLVEDELADATHVENAARDVVEQSPRGPDKHARPAGQELAIAVHRVAARDRRHAHAGELGDQPLQLPAHLGGELPGRHDDQRLGAAAARRLLQARHEHEAQGDRLAGAGL